MIGRPVLPLAIMLTVAGCAVRPPDWAVNMEPSTPFGCGSSVEDIGKFTGKPVEKLETPHGWRTHVIREKDTVVWLGFEDGKLRYYQPTWRVWGRMAQYSSMDICENRYFSDIPVPRRR